MAVRWPARRGEIVGAGGAISLTDLSDVSGATLTSGFALMANGTTYAGRALVEADISDLGSYLSAGDSPTITGQWSFTDDIALTGDLAVTGALKILDSGGTDFGNFSHNGQDYLAAFTNTTSWAVSGITTFSFSNTTSIKRIKGLYGQGDYVVLAAQDQGSAQPYAGYNITLVSSVAIHKVLGAASGTLYQNNGSIKWYSAGSAAALTTISPTMTLDSSTFTVSTVGMSLGSKVAASTTDLSDHIAMYGTNYGMCITGGTLNLVANGSNSLQVKNGQVNVRGTLRVQNANNTDYLDFSHDGTDFNIAGTLTTDINITGAALRIGGNVGFYNTAPVAQPTAVAVTAAGIHAALVTLGLIT